MCAPLLPGATETAYILGLADRLVAVPHERDFSPEAEGRMRVAGSTLTLGVLKAGAGGARS